MRELGVCVFEKAREKKREEGAGAGIELNHRHSRRARNPCF